MNRMSPCRYSLVEAGRLSNYGSMVSIPPNGLCSPIDYSFSTLSVSFKLVPRIWLPFSVHRLMCYLPLWLKVRRTSAKFNQHPEYRLIRAGRPDIYYTCNIQCRFKTLVLYPWHRDVQLFSKITRNSLKIYFPYSRKLASNLSILKATMGRTKFSCIFERAFRNGSCNRFRLTHIFCISLADL